MQNDPQCFRSWFSVVLKAQMKQQKIVHREIKGFEWIKVIFKFNQTAHSLFLFTLKLAAVTVSMNRTGDEVAVKPH